MRRLLLAVTLVFFAFAGSAGAATYYVSSTGSDANGGTSTTSAWRSVSRVNSAPLAPGDSVLFEGGSTFSGLLQPPASGASGAPITFGSYGSGQANLSGGIQITSKSWLAFDNLRVDTGAWQTAGSVRGIKTSDTGTGVQNVVVRSCSFVNVAIGLLFSNRLDRDWTVSNSLIQWTRDSGILIFDPNQPDEVGGSNMTFDGNQILDTGVDSTITWKKHAVYDIGTNVTWKNNVFRRWSEGGISLRARGNIIVGNTFSDGPYAIYHSPYDATAGTTTIAYNKISNVTGDAIELAASGTVANVESYVIANNTIASVGSAPGIRVIGTAGSVKIANNLVTTQTGPLFRIDQTPGGGLVEKNNLWFSATPSWGFNGGAYATLAAYRTASGQGVGDKSVDPLLGGSLVPAAGSPAIDGGTSSVDASVSYAGDCSGQLYHYCGAAPDMGAAEASAPTPAPTPPPAPAPPPPPAPLAPPSGLTVSGVGATSLTLAWTKSTDARVASYRVSVDGAAVGTTTAASTGVSNLSCGAAHSFSVAGLDAAGNASSAITASATTAACPDKTPPALTITWPTNGQTIPTTFTIKANASDTGGVKNVTFWFDGYAPCVDAVAPYVSCTITTSTGGHTIRVRATDNAGNYTEQIIKIWADASRRVLSTQKTIVRHVVRKSHKHR